MSKFFNPPFIGSRAPTVLPMFTYVMSRMNNELTKVYEYYRENFVICKSEHVLYRLLNEFSNYMHLDKHVLYKQISMRRYQWESAYGFVSAIHNGGMNRKGEMFNMHTQEVWLSVEYPNLDIEKCYNHYQMLKPVRIVSHDFTDTNLPLINGKLNSVSFGYAVTTIDIALLALQFKAWWDKNRKVIEKNLTLPMTLFINRYVLVNAISTYTDVAIFNRLHKHLKGESIPQSGKHHPFQVYDNNGLLDETLKRLNDTFIKRPADWIHYLSSIPSLEYGSYWRCVTYPDMAPTRQVKWAMVLSKLNTLEYLLDLEDKQVTGSEINLLERDILDRELGFMINDRSLIENIPTTAMNRILVVKNRVSRNR